MRVRINSTVAAMLMSWSITCAPAALQSTGVLVVAHPDTPMLDEQTLQKIYLGKIVEIDGRPIIPVNLTRGSTMRKTFMEKILAQDDEKFIAYWTVRRYIGKGSPPREFASVEEQLEYLRNTPGAIGYLDERLESKTGLKTMLKKP
jgi:ABC-type phosphate transport system substrate-binding protein